MITIQIRVDCMVTDCAGCMVTDCASCMVTDCAGCMAIEPGLKLLDPLKFDGKTLMGSLGEGGREQGIGPRYVS